MSTENKKYDQPEGPPRAANEPRMRYYSSQEEQELERLRESMNRTDTEKCRILMGLMKVGKMMSNATIHHKD